MGREYRASLPDFARKNKEHQMKKHFLLASICALLLGAAAFGQNSVTIQPYLSFDWDPLYFDPVIGDHYGNYRALNFDRAGLRLTGNLDKITAFIEARGFPIGSRDFYNKYDGGTPMLTLNWEKPLYLAWGKYQLTETGNVWAGKFLPIFGPKLFDWEHFGIGWQQRIAGAHTVSAFLLEPDGANGRFMPPGVTANRPEADNVGMRILVMEEYMSQTMALTGGVLYEYLPQDTAEDASKVYFNIFASHWGIPNLTINGELGMVIYAQKNGIIKDTSPEDSGVGLGAFIGAEYRIYGPFSAGLFFVLFDPLLGAKKVNLMAGDITPTLPPGTPGREYSGNFFQFVDGEVAMASIGAYANFSPGGGFSIQPGVTINLANALNNTQPVKHNGDDGSKAGVSFELRFCWEPSFRLEF